jgi:hypothetical protein
MVKNNRILFIAISVSLIGHVFWMSALKVVASPAPARSIKFGKISFLGPTAFHTGMELKLSPRQRSLLEKRYLASLDHAAYEKPRPGGSEYLDYEPDCAVDGPIRSLITDAITGDKAEPEKVM